jgi:hypothetical protein
MLGKTHDGPLVKLYDYDGDGNRLKLTTKPELEKSCIKENDGRFGQTEDAPFMMPPLLDNFGYLRDNTVGSEVLLGTYCIPPSVNEYTNKFIEMLHLPPGFKPPPDSAFDADYSNAKVASIHAHFYNIMLIFTTSIWWM